MKVLDTQILSYAFKDTATEFQIDPLHHQIPATVATEFLETHGHDPSRAVYHVPLVKATHPTITGSLIASHKKRGFSAARADLIVLDFRGEYPSLACYGHLALTQLINRRDFGVFDAAVAHMEKGMSTAARKRVSMALAALFPMTSR